MVRFSDMLGEHADPDRPSAAVPVANPVAGAEDEALDPSDPEDAADAVDEAAGVPNGASAPAAAWHTPEDVLDRLTQYATSARAADQAPTANRTPTEDRGPAPEPSRTEGADGAGASPATDAAADFAPVDDDLLPGGRGSEPRSGRRRKRR